MASRSLDDLDPRVREAAHAVAAAWEAGNQSVLVTATLRTNAEQEALYKQGRTAPGAIVTHARAGESYHNFGLALDFVPIVHGKLVWDSDSQLWKIIALMAQQVDPRLQWGGDWSIKRRDLPHLEWDIEPNQA
jgi:peptidoglycan L-alanyl-D-glutamate endopeptidase CwlK